DGERLEVRPVQHGRFQSGTIERPGDVIGGLVDAVSLEPAALALVAREVEDVLADPVEGFVSVEGGREAQDGQSGDEVAASRHEFVRWERLKPKSIVGAA